MDTSVREEKQYSSVLPMAIVAVLFFILGFATWLNGSLMPYIKISAASDRVLKQI